MTYHTDDSAFSARVFFVALAGLGLLAGAVIVYVFASRPHVDRDAVAVTADSLTSGDAASSPSASDGGKPTREEADAIPPLPDAPPHETLPPSVPAASSVAVAPPAPVVADDATAATGDDGVLLGDWRVRLLKAVPSFFAFTESGVAAPRAAGAAPIGERYVHVELELSWRGVDPRRLEVSRSGSLRPSVVLSADSQSFDPAGRVAEERDAFTPLRTDSVVWQPGETKTIAIAFRVPKELDSAVLSLEDQAGPLIELTAAGDADGVQLAGRWRRSNRLLQAVRRGEPVFDAMNADTSRVLLITRSGGTLSVSLPGAGVSGKGALGPAGVALTLGRETAPARFQLLEDGAGLLVYVGAGGRSALLYERWPELE